MQIKKDVKEFGKENHKWWHILDTHTKEDFKSGSDDIDVYITYCTRCGYEKKTTIRYISDIKETDSLQN